MAALIRTLSVIALLAASSGAALAQTREETLADIRQELSMLFVEVQRLKRELSTTGSPSLNLSGTSALDRINAIEAELQRLTANSERLENRIDRIVADGTNRIGDLEFRLVELEGGDLSQLGETTTLGGDAGLPVAAAPAPAPAVPQNDGGAQLAVGEQSDFDRAKGAFDEGAFEDAVIQFATFTETYIGGPLTGQAHFWRGEALSKLGDARAAARAYLASFSGDPDGVVAPDALLQLGRALDKLGQFDESCVMLDEVGVRFPGSAAAQEAQTEARSMGCG
ncbi:MAG: tol-pal system protein YbgF [Rhodobacteraceae bacterium]|nr:tol-pal system protein YbgF [Paracoccaceae bacterium]